MNYQPEYMDLALKLALANVQHHNGGPFGAVIVKDNEIIATGANWVTATNDPTAHAEIVAIRHACAVLESFQLTGCSVYSSCEPCPMCFGALYWARPQALYYAASRFDAATIGFDDAFIYEQLALPGDKRSMPFIKVEIPEALEPFKMWHEKVEKIRY